MCYCLAAVVDARNRRTQRSLLARLRPMAMIRGRLTSASDTLTWVHDVMGTHPRMAETSSTWGRNGVISCNRTL